MDSTVTLNTSICNLTRPDTNPNNFDLLQVVLHEMDEVLGGGSALDGLAQNAPPPATIAPLDLYRYAAPAVRSFSTHAPTGAASQAYFSIDGGITDLVNFNQKATGDFGDWYSYPYGASTPPGPEIQDAFATPGAMPNLGMELTRLDVLGFTLNAAPPVMPVVMRSAASLAANATSLVIAGLGFDTTPANDVLTLSSGVTGTVSRASNTQLTITNLHGLMPGVLTASVKVDGQGSGMPVQVATVIPVITPSTANLPASGSTLTIQGFGFSSTAAANTVKFTGGATGKVLHATPTQLTVANLSGLVAGTLSATVTVGKWSSVSKPVATVTPVVTASQATLAVGATTVTIHGFGFASTAAANTVTFSDGAAGNVTHATATTLTVAGVGGAPAGSLAARVTSNGVRSAGYVQVATVPITPPRGTSHIDSATQITLSWTTVAGATKYEVAQVQANGTLSLLYTLGGGTTSQSVPVKPGSTNTFRVGATDAVATAWSTPLKVTSYTLAPSVRSSTASATQATLSWNALPGTTAYIVEEELKNGANTTIATVGSGTTQYTFIEPANGLNRFLVQDVGGHGTLTLNSRVATVTQITLSWAGLAGATSYEIDVQLAGGSWKKLGTVGTTHYAFTGQPGTTYTFRVGATDAAGTEFSNPVVVSA
jgi:hypothetical protein